MKEDWKMARKSSSTKRGSADRLHINRKKAGRKRSINFLQGLKLFRPQWKSGKKK
jgi:hypothetical protein